MAYVKNSIMLGSGGGGTTITVVANYSALPDPTTVSGQFYWAEAEEGSNWNPFVGAYRNAGMYYSNGVSWTFMNVPYQATQSEVNSGTNDTKFVTPKTFTDASKWSTKQDTLTETNFGSFSNSLTGKTTPVDADSVNIVDSADSNKAKKTTFTNLKAFFKTYFDSLYAVKSSTMIQLSAYAGANSTSLQKMFNVGSGGGGAFNASANKTYRFIWEFDLTGLSGVSGSMSLGFLGTATISAINYKGNVVKAGTLSGQTSGTITSIQTASATVMTATSTSTNAKGRVSGIIRVSTSGTIIPAYLTSAGSASVQTEANSFFEITELGSDTFTATSDIS